MNYKDDDIAIIGMAGRFPGADHPDAFWANLLNENDLVKEFPASRIEELAVMCGDLEDVDYIREGYLPQMMQFEPQIFAISAEESKYIDPQQRLLFELVEEAILDAGYNPESLSGREIGVFVTENDRDFVHVFAGNHMMAHINSISASNAGRIAYTYNFCGPVFTVSSACSSSLVAIHTACNALKLGEVECAIAGGARIILLPPDKKILPGNPIASVEQKIRAFDKDADGTIGGEGGGILCLKLLSKALQDGDPIHAIIKGSAVNSDGRRSNGMNAPSEDGQCDVILKAIEQAKIDPLSISYIESHGTGTKIGDPIEVAGLNSALHRLGYPVHSVPIGSLKTNIGHLDVASGVASVIKTVLSLKHQQIPASLHFTEINPLIDLQDSPVYINHTRQDWLTSTVRRAGVTSLSLMGTNAHLILEEAPSMESPSPCRERGNIITLSARTERSLAAMIERLKEFLRKHPQTPLDDLAYTLNTGRRKLDQQLITTACSTRELLTRLVQGQYQLCERKEQRVLKPIFIFPALEDVALDECGLDLSPYGPADLSHAGVKYFLIMVAYVQLLEKYSISCTAVMGFGAGKNVVDVIKGRISFAEGLARAKETVNAPERVEVERLRKAVAGISQAGLEYWMLFCPSPAFQARFHGVVEENSSIRFVCLDAGLGNFYEELVDQLAQGFAVDWGQVYQGEKRRRISLPGYVFDRKGYYPGVDHTDEEEDDDGWEPAKIQAHLASMLQELYVGELPMDAYFFDLGLTSMAIMFFIGKVKKEYGVQLSVTLFFDDITLEEVLHKVVDKIVQESRGGNLIARQPVRPYYPTSSAQKRQFVLNLLQTDTNYNITFGFVIEGKLDVQRLEEIVQALVRRHESLRTYFEFVNGELMQKVVEDLHVEMEYLTGAEDELEAIIERLIRPFTLTQLPLLRVGLIRYADRHLFLLDLHHIITDGLSMQILVQDFAALYAGQELEELRTQYKDFAVWENQLMESEAFQQQEAFWLQTFKGKLPVLDLKTDYPRPTEVDFTGEVLEMELGQEIKAQLAALNTRHGTTMYMTLLAIFTVLLSKYSAQEDIIVGSPISGREHADVERVVGMFVNTLAMRNYPVMDLTFAQFLAEVKQNTLLAFENQNYPLDLLVEKLEIARDPGRNPLFTVMFAMQSFLGKWKITELGTEELTFTSYPVYEKRTKFDLSLEAIPGDGFILLKLYYATTLFKAETMVQFLHHFLRIVETVAADDTVKLIDIELAAASTESTTDLRSEIDFEF